jgi:hypothetical protein
MVTARRLSAFPTPRVDRYVGRHFEFPLKLSVALVTVLLPLAACGGHNPAAPGDAESGVIGLGIIGADEILSGAQSSYSTTATSSGGPTRIVTPSWTSSDPAVAIVDASGRVEGRSHGSFTLTAAYAGREVSKTVHVIANYSGHWEGRTRITSCEGTGDLIGWCRIITRPGTYLLTFDIAQDIANPRQIAAPGLDLRGVVTDDGRLTLGGSTNMAWDEDDRTVYAIRERRWDSSLSAPDAMTGGYHEDWRAFLLQIGTAHVEHELTTMSRSSSRTLR